MDGNAQFRAIRPRSECALLAGFGRSDSRRCWALPLASMARWCGEGGQLAGNLHLLGWLLFEVVGDLLLQGTGRLMLRSRRNPDPSEAACMVAGLLLWCAACVAGVAAWQSLAA